jgi:2,3-bisphosphoglycerate-independent phosphoglycerate mutase
MKSVIFLGDGMSDYPIPALGGRTPLQAARKPGMDRIAKEGCSGLFESVPDGQSKGSAVANLSVLGYDPAVVYQGRAVLEAANMGIDIGPQEVALRCNLICIEDENIKNHSAGHITSAEAAEIIMDLDAALGRNGPVTVRFYSGVSYRHLMVLGGAGVSPRVRCAPPHDYVDKPALPLLPSPGAEEGEATAALLRELFDRSREILEEHPVNKKRIAEGKDPANAIWPWSPGRKPMMATFQERFGIKGAVISAVDLIMGLGLYAGMDVLRVAGATGLWDTNYEGKAEACIKGLEDHDLVYVHVEATDEAGHARDLEMKIKCIEMLDSRIIVPVMEGIEKKGYECQVAVLPDHPTPVSTGVHARDKVPVAVMGTGRTPDSVTRYDEAAAATGSLGELRGDEFIREVLLRR